jgi:hypothetical protein
MIKPIRVTIYLTADTLDQVGGRILLVLAMVFFSGVWTLLALSRRLIKEIRGRGCGAKNRQWGFEWA